MNVREPNYDLVMMNDFYSCYIDTLTRPFKVMMMMQIPISTEDEAMMTWRRPFVID
jgi:hypothetical protein